MIYKKFQPMKLRSQTSQQKESGFVIIIALITSTIILSIAIGVLSISLKDYVFSGFTTSSTKALFAADTGLDCALAFDLKNTSVPAPAPEVLDPTISFANAQTYDVTATFNDNSRPYAIAAIDLDDDGGGMDIVVTAQGYIHPTPGDKIFIFKNDGLGAFSQVGYFSTESTPWGVVVGDLNGDGYEDIAVSNRNGNSISVFINSTTGSFVAKVNYTLVSSSNPRALAIGDFDGVKGLDLAVSIQDGSSSKIAVLLNDGSGSFPVVQYSVGFPLLSDPNSIAVGDLDGINGPDLAVVYTTSSKVRVLLNNGNGAFPSATAYDTLGTFPMSVSIGDLNGDGELDLAITNWGDNNTATVLINNGSGLFTSSFSYDFAQGATDYHRSTAVDLNGDNKLDLAVTNEQDDHVTILRNTGIAGNPYSSGTFTIQSSNYPVPNNPQHVIAADFDGKGGKDLATSNFTDNSFSVFLNNGPQYTAETCLPSPYTDPDPDIPYPTINCGGQDVIIDDISCDCTTPPSTTPRTCTTSFIIGNSSDASVACAEVEIVSTYDHKGTEDTLLPTPDEEKTRIRSRGHNSCDLNNPRRVERALELNYGQ